MPKTSNPYQILTGAQCRELDEKTIKEFGIDGITLMEVAGTRAADFILQQIENPSHGLILCGKGNNAGDALVVARLLSEKNYKISVHFVSGTEDLSDDTSHNLELLKKLDGDIHFMDDFRDQKYDFIVDGMLGTGLNSDVRAPYSEIIEWANEQDFPVFSMDVPSGLNADTGKILGTATRADFTLTFGALKTGFYLNEGKETSGQIILCELPFPNKYKKPTAFLVSEEDFKDQDHIQPKRKHKYDGGVIYIIGGSEGLTGAAILTAKSAWAGGAGAVILITPKGLLEIYEKNLIQIIKKSVGTEKDSFFTTTHLGEVKQVLSEKEGTLIIGPGLGRDSETITFVQEILKTFKGDAVIDADALYALDKAEKWQKPESSNWILTPHPGELKTLFGKNMDDDLERMNLVREQSQKLKVTIVSKGWPVLLGTVNGEIYLTSYDSRIFSRAGFGDVLAGKTGAYWKLGISEEETVIKALLDGYIKAKKQVSVAKFPEPLNII